MRTFDNRTPVVLMTRVDRLASHGVLGAMRTLGRAGVAVHWVHHGGRPPAATSRYASGLVEWAPGGSAEDDVALLLGLAQRLGGKPVLVPTDDVAVAFTDDHADVLADAYRFPCQPAGLAARLSDKRAMHALCAEFGVPTPHAVFPQTRGELERIADEVVYPVVLKGIDTTLLGQRTGVRMVIAETRAELVGCWARLAGDAGPELMVQEYIPGGPDSVWMFNGYFDANSVCRFGACGQKLRQAPPYTGATSLGVCVENETVRATTARLMKAVGYRGILDIGYRFDARDGLYKLLDVNPRLGATFRLFAADDGLDVLTALYLDLTGQPLPAARCRHGRKWLLETSDAHSALVYRRDGLLSGRSWITSLRGVDEVAWVARDDPRPAASAFADVLRKRAPITAPAVPEAS